MQRLDVISGRLLEAGDEGGVLLGEAVASKSGKGVGGKITVIEEHPDFTVVGIYRGKLILEDGMVIVLLSDLQKFMGKQGKVSGFSIVLDHPGDEKEINRVKAEIQKLSKNIDVLLPADIVNTTGQIQLVRAMSWVTSVIALIIGAIGMLNTMVMSVFERTKEIGILRDRMEERASDADDPVGGAGAEYHRRGRGDDRSDPHDSVPWKPPLGRRPGLQRYFSGRHVPGFRHRDPGRDPRSGLSGLPRRTTPSHGGPSP